MTWGRARRRRSTSSRRAAGCGDSIHWKWLTYVGNKYAVLLSLSVGFLARLSCGKKKTSNHLCVDEVS